MKNEKNWQKKKKNIYDINGDHLIYLLFNKHRWTILINSTDNPIMIKDNKYQVPYLQLPRVQKPCPLHACSHSPINTRSIAQPLVPMPEVCRNLNRACSERVETGTGSVTRFQLSVFCASKWAERWVCEWHWPGRHVTWRGNHVMPWSVEYSNTILQTNIETILVKRWFEFFNYVEKVVLKW